MVRFAFLSGASIGRGQQVRRRRSGFGPTKKAGHTFAANANSRRRSRVAANGRPLGRGRLSRDQRFWRSTRVGCSRTGPASAPQSTPQGPASAFATTRLRPDKKAGQCRYEANANSRRRSRVAARLRQGYGAQAERAPARVRTPEPIRSFGGAPEWAVRGQDRPGRLGHLQL